MVQLLAAVISSRRAGAEGRTHLSLQPRAASFSALTQDQANPPPAAALLKTAEFQAGDKGLMCLLFSSPQWCGLATCIETYLKVF